MSENSKEIEKVCRKPKWKDCVSRESYEKSREEFKTLQIIVKRLIADLHREAPEKYPDNCTICHGDNGGVKGNENIIDGIVMCDYCHADRMK